MCALEPNHGRNSLAPSSDLISLLAARAEHQPEQLAYRFIADDGLPVSESRQDTLTYSALQRAVEELVCRLAPSVAGGAGGPHPPRVVLVFPPGLEFVAAFFACLHLGVTAVPLPPPGRRRLERLRAVLRHCGATVLLTPASVARHLDELLSEERAATGHAPTLVVSDVPLAVGNTIPAAAFDPDRTAFLQYTSGSTGLPRGVQVTCANLGDNLAHIRDRFGHNVDSRGVIWLPPYHDMGLIGGLLQPLFVGFPVTLMAPGAFIRNPLRWLQAIDFFRASTSGGPNFAYEHCLSRISESERRALDLSSWKVAFNGAEAVSSSTLDRFATAFAESGFDRAAWLPCYGLAEATLIVSGGSVGGGANTIHIDRDSLSRGTIEISDTLGEAALPRVGNGPAVDGHEILCVDPETHEPTSADRIGEIWVRGPSVARGYWRDEEATREIFGARTSAGAGPFVRTGDLGFMREGNLFVSGRRKDLIILRGRNLFPSDLERRIEEGDSAVATNATAAFAVETEAGERLVIAHEPVRRFDLALADTLMASIRSSVVAGFEVSPDEIVLLEPGRLPKTPSGKVQRVACRDLFLASAFGELARWTRPNSVGLEDENSVEGLPPVLETRPDANAQEIEAFMLDWVSRRLGLALDTLDRDRPMSEFGLDSVGSVELAAALGIWLEREDAVEETLVWDHPTAVDVALYLAGDVLPDQRVRTPRPAAAGEDDMASLDAAELLAAELARARSRRS